jgi:hypothetical protein
MSISKLSGTKKGCCQVFDQREGFSAARYGRNFARTCSSPLARLASICAAASLSVDRATHCAVPSASRYSPVPLARLQADAGAGFGE